MLNNSLRREVEDLRVQSTDSHLLRNRLEEMMAVFVIMSVEIESLRGGKF